MAGDATASDLTTKCEWSANELRSVPLPKRHNILGYHSHPAILNFQIPELRNNYISYDHCLHAKPAAQPHSECRKLELGICTGCYSEGNARVELRIAITGMLQFLQNYRAKSYIQFCSVAVPLKVF